MGGGDGNGVARATLGTGVPRKRHEKTIVVQKPGKTSQPTANQVSASSPPPITSMSANMTQPTRPPMTELGRCRARSHLLF